MNDVDDPGNHHGQKLWIERPLALPHVHPHVKTQRYANCYQRQSDVHRVVAEPIHVFQRGQPLKKYSQFSSAHFPRQQNIHDAGDEGNAECCIRRDHDGHVKFEQQNTAQQFGQGLIEINEHAGNAMQDENDGEKENSHRHHFDTDFEDKIN